MLSFGTLLAQGSATLDAGDLAGAIGPETPAPGNIPAESKPQHYLSYPRLREADVFWEKRAWQELNICSEFNASLDDGSANLGQLLAEAVAAGQLRAFSPGSGVSLFGAPWPGQSAGVGAPWPGRSAAVRDQAGAEPAKPAPGYEVDPTTVWIVEDWLMDESSFERRPRIIALGLVANSQLVALIPFDEARPLLVQTQAIRPTKTEQGLSWDGVLLLRRFDARELTQ